MKKTIVLALVILSSVAAQASITINLGASMLFMADGTTPAPVGSLIQLIASTTDNIFTAPTAQSFVGGSSDDQIIASFTYNLGAGSALQPIMFNLAGTLNAGDFLLLRWFPTVALGDAAPAAGSAYGQFRIDIQENGSTITWMVPADGSTDTLNFLTMSSGGTEPDAAGRAAMTVIPEPSTVALLGVSLAGLLAFAQRRKA